MQVVFHAPEISQLLTYSGYQDYEKGGWNFPKMHLIQHLFEDIEAKGATHNYSSKPFEKMHGSLGVAYTRLTNFKDVGSQVGNNHLIHMD